MKIHLKVNPGILSDIGLSKKKKKITSYHGLVSSLCHDLNRDKGMHFYLLNDFRFITILLSVMARNVE